MEDADKTPTQLSEELATLRQRVAEVQALAAEQQRAEEALRQSEERYRSLVDSSRYQESFGEHSWLQRPATRPDKRKKNNRGGRRDPPASPEQCCHTPRSGHQLPGTFAYRSGASHTRKAASSGEGPSASGGAAV